MNETAGGYRFVRNAPDLHLIFGWLQVGRVHDIGDPLPQDLQWVAYHPHLNFKEKFKRNRVYIAAESLSFDSRLPGAGTFCRYDKVLRLTAPDKTRSWWLLPKWFFHNERTRRFSQRQDDRRWIPDGDSVLFDSGGIGQEFVISADDYAPDIFGWLRNLFSAALVA